VDKSNRMDVIVFDVEGNEGYFVNGRLFGVSPADRRGAFAAGPEGFFDNLGKALGASVQVRRVTLDPDRLNELGLDWKSREWTDLELSIQEGRIGAPSPSAPAAAAARIEDEQGRSEQP
jgi:hypothetical protein